MLGENEDPVLTENSKSIEDALNLLICEGIKSLILKKKEKKHLI